MKKSRMYLPRIVFIDEEIRKGIYPNCSSLAKKYEVSPKTIQRDIDYLKYSMDAPVEYDNARRGFYYTEPNYHLPSIDIKESDFFAICIAEKALEQYKNTQIYDKLQGIFDKIKLFLPDEIRVKTSWIDNRFTFMQESHTIINPDIWEKISLGLRHQKKINILHKKAGSEPVRRFVNPYHLASFRGEWYLIAWCHKRRTILKFAISRILQADVTEESFVIPEDFDFDTFLGPSMGIVTENREYPVKIKFTSAISHYITERMWHPDQLIKKNKDGSIILSFKTNSLFEVKRWVLSWGPGTEILSPAFLAEEVKKDLEEMMGEYG